MKSHPQQGRMHDPLIAKLSHIVSTPILQFFYASSSCLSQDSDQIPSASLQQLLQYIQRFLHGQPLLYFYISYHAELKKEEINISTMKTQQRPNKCQYLTCNQSVILKPKLPEMIWWHPDCNMSMKFRNSFRLFLRKIKINLS